MQASQSHLKQALIIPGQLVEFGFERGVAHRGAHVLHLEIGYLLRVLDQAGFHHLLRLFSDLVPADGLKLLHLARHLGLLRVKVLLRVIDAVRRVRSRIDALHQLGRKGIEIGEDRLDLGIFLTAGQEQAAKGNQECESLRIGEASTSWF